LRSVGGKYLHQILTEEGLMAKARSIPSLTDLSWVDELSFKQLAKLAEEIRSQIEVKREEAREQLRQELLEKARELGIDPAQLVPARRVNRIGVKPKYRAPDGTTWTGRGRAPKVFQELFDKGHAKDEFLIKP
jgi:DNA-binding protein H-NS